MTISNLRAALEPLVSRVRTDVTATKTERGMIWTREALTEVRLKRHLDGGQPRGVCPIKAGESTTRVALFDLDSHKGETSWKSMTMVADDLCEVLLKSGLVGTQFSSSGGKGIHVYLLWDEDQDAYSVRQELKRILLTAGMKDGAKGVAAGEIEVFPKQDSVPLDGFGNQFILPLAGLSAPIYEGEIMPRDFDPGWKVSAPVPVLEHPVREVVPYAGGDLDELRSALAAVPNDGEGLGYDEWRDIIIAIHYETGGSDDGWALAVEFSSRSHKFDEDELQFKVWDWLSGRPPSANPITGATILFHAREAGWNEVTADSFVAVVDDKPEELPLPAYKRDGNGRIEAVIGNLRAALARPDVCLMDIRYDEFRDELVFADTDAKGIWRPFRDSHYVELRLRLEAQGFKPIGKETMRDIVHYIADRNRIDTAMVWLDSLAWDGVSRIDGFLARYFSVPATPYAAAVSRYWWTAMAGRVFKPGCQADMVPILISPEQGFRKSSSVAAMVPPDTHRQLSFTQAEVERARLMRGCLAAELAELQGLRTKELEEIKAWVTRRHEEWVPKYKEFAVTMPRRAIFVGTSNAMELFDDPTGERRWLPVRVGVVDVEGIARDRDQLWAEAAAIWKRDGVAWQEAERLGRVEHGAYRVLDTWEDDFVAWAATKTLEDIVPAERGFTTREALVEGLEFASKHVRKNEIDRAVKALRKAGFDQKEYRRDGKKGRYWRLVSQVPHTETCEERQK
ncbi:VapE domain-containing protein [Brevundimonas sp. TWP2-3-4b1]|uniref:VapE domain-containing protein n=1 Tax=Brevundimonas sp. TWP2-3-4b1 TaxID=2804580 RepID=UPI003CE9060A